MGRTVNIGAQSFEELRLHDSFLVDKTDFIRQWWEARDTVTLLCRPRRFGKTLNMSMLECFFSTKYAGRGEELFGGMDIWQHKEYRNLQGTVPVVFVRFADCKGTPEVILAKMRMALRMAVDKHRYLLDSEKVAPNSRALLARVADDMDDATASGCLQQLCAALEQYWGVQPIVLIDEYDTPMQECWLAGAWDAAVNFLRPLFNSTFKTNPSLGRGLITGVTRVSRESIFSDLNNLAVVTTTTERYETCFGFTEEEVFAALDEMGMDAECCLEVKEWYDGFTFGIQQDIYNPWSITNYLSYGHLDTYWANTSSNALVSSLVRTGDGDLQNDFESLLQGETLTRQIDEQVVFNELDGDPDAVWSLLLATGYLKSESRTWGANPQHVLAITNFETRLCFEKMVRGWFKSNKKSYNRFVSSLLACDIDAANQWLSALLPGVISTFDGGVAGGGSSAPENFYHGLVLGLLVELRGRYEVTSNRESGFGRYDVMLCPLNNEDPAFVMEFKVQDIKREATLEDTCERALQQLRDRAYATQLAERGIAPARIHELAFAFSGKEVLIVE